MHERERERERLFSLCGHVGDLVANTNNQSYERFPLCVCVCFSKYIYIYIKEIGLLNVQAFIESRLSILFTHKFALILIPKRTSKIVIITPRLQTQNLTSKYPM